MVSKIIFHRRAWLGNLYSFKKDKYNFKKIKKLAKNIILLFRNACIRYSSLGKSSHWGHDITSENKSIRVRVIVYS